MSGDTGLSLRLATARTFLECLRESGLIQSYRWDEEKKVWMVRALTT